MYLTYILIYFNDEKSYRDYVIKMLKKLKKIKLKIKLKKFKLYVQKVKFLKFFISYKKIKMNKDRIRVIIN